MENKPEPIGTLRLSQPAKPVSSINAAKIEVNREIRRIPHKLIDLSDPLPCKMNKEKK